MNKPSYQELEKRILELEEESLQRERIEAELLKKQAALRAQNISVVRKSIELSDIKRELEDKNYDLELSRSNIEEAMGALRKARDELELRVEERTRELAKANEGLQTEISERKRAEEALRESEEKYRTQFEEALDAMFLSEAETGILVDCNHAASVLVGRTKSEIVGKPQTILHPPEEVEGEFSRTYKQHLEDKEGQSLEAQVITKDGEIRDVSIKANIFETKGKKFMQGIFRDVTERKQAEEALHTYHEKLQSLASKLSLAEERQRRRVAIEVHDRISQNLAFVKMKLGTLRASTSSSGLAGAMEEILKLVDETIQNTRALISELGSPILYELGFVPAVEWLTQQTQKQHGIVLAFEDDGQPKPLSEDVRVLLFQAVRELLVNIAKHAQARTAKVSITRSGDQVRVDVEDDGVGFDSAEIGSSVDTTGRFGLFSIRVRLEPLGGDMEVESKPGHGTRVTLIAPLKHNGGNKKEKVS